MLSISQRYGLNEILDYQTFIVFKRLQRFHKSLNVVSALLAGLSLAVLTFEEYHPTQTDIFHASEGLLCSSAMTSVISITLSTMLLFKFDGYESATKKEFLVAWTPLVFLDLAAMEFLFGLALWYAAKNNIWRAAVMSSQLGFLLIYCFIVAGWMWLTRSFKAAIEKDRRPATLHGTTFGSNVESFEC